MTRRIRNAPSLANSDHFDLAADTDALAQAGVTMFHVDLMDGHYVPNLCFSVDFVADLHRRHPAVEIDAHLMVDDPARYAERLATAGATWASFPLDSTRFVRRTARVFREHGLRPGVALNPSQPVADIAPVIADLDYVVLMTVEPGFAGQRFLDGSFDRLSELAALRDALAPDCAIQIDGGIDPTSGAECVRRGADILVTGVFAVYRQDGGFATAVPAFDTAMATAAAEVAR